MRMIIISWGAKYSRELVLSRLDKHCCKYSPSFLQIFKYIHSSQVSRWSSIVPTFCHQTDGRNVRVSSFPFQHQNPVKAPKNRWKHTPKSAISYPHHHQGQHQHYQYYISIPMIKIDMLTITVILVILHQDRRICSCLIWPQFVLPAENIYSKILWFLFEWFKSNDFDCPWLDLWSQCLMIPSVHHHHHRISPSLAPAPSPIPPNVFTVRDDV